MTVWALTALLVAVGRQGRYGEALAHARRAAALAAGSPDTRSLPLQPKFFLGLALVDCDLIGEARAVFRQALDDDRPRFRPSAAEQRRLLLDFVAAAREGDLARLESMLKDSVTSWTDSGGRLRAARRPVIGRERVAHFFAHIYTRPGFAVTEVDLATGPALKVLVRGEPHVLTVHTDGSGITAIHLQANPEKLSSVER